MKLTHPLLCGQAMHSFFQAGSSTSSPLWADPWVQCCAEVTLLGEPLPLPGFSLVLGYQPDDSSKTKIVEMVRKRYHSDCTAISFNGKWNVCH